LAFVDELAPHQRSANRTLREGKLLKGPPVFVGRTFYGELAPPLSVPRPDLVPAGVAKATSIPSRQPFAR
jgi:hypothetical protein